MLLDLTPSPKLGLFRIYSNLISFRGTHLIRHGRYFIVIVGVHVLQFICTVALVQSRTKMPLFGAVSLHRLVGVP